jgi:putative peptide zinc metalloprotease protein
VNKLRAAIGLGIAGVFLLVLLCIPLPYYVACTLEIQPRGGYSVYVDVPGELREVLVRGGNVTAGQPLARLDDVELRLSERRLLAQRGDLAVRIDGIRLRAHTDDQALLELAQTQEALAALDKQISRLQVELGRLTIRAPAAGVFVLPPSRAKPTQTLQLAAWNGRPLETRNVGAYLETSTLVGRIAQPGQLEAILAIDQDEVDFVRTGQVVDLLLDSLPGQRLSSRIDRIAEQNMQTAPTRLAVRAGGDLATRPDAEGIERPVSVVYQASAPVDDPSGEIVIGAIGLARIRAGYQPLWQRVWRTACRTFRFEM